MKLFRRRKQKQENKEKQENKKDKKDKKDKKKSKRNKKHEILYDESRKRETLKSTTDLLKKKKPLANRIYKFFIILIAGILILHHLYQNSSLFYSNNLNLPFSLHLNVDDLYLVKGEEFHLYVYAINERVSFYSTNFGVAGVNFNGRVFGYHTGKAFIIASVDNRELKCRVHVIDINKKKVSLKVGETYHLKIRGSHAFVGWRSKNKSVATVGLFGNVTAKKKGTTIIYGKIKGKTLKCVVVVE